MRKALLLFVAVAALAGASDAFPQAAVAAKLREADAIALCWLKSLDLTPLPPVTFANPADHKRSEDEAAAVRSNGNQQLEQARDIIAGKRWPNPEPGDIANRVRCLAPDLEKALALRSSGGAKP